MPPSLPSSEWQMQTHVLLSVKPTFAEAILDGRKKFEFRRVVFRNPSVRTIVLYASSPVRRVVGEFSVESVLTGSPTAVWRATSDGAGINRDYYRNYFQGRRQAHALVVRNPKRYRKSLCLQQDYGIPYPPQSFCYLH